MLFKFLRIFLQALGNGHYVPSMMQPDVDVSPLANIVTIKLTLTYVTFDVDPYDI